MIERLAFGELPKKHHIRSLGPDGALRWEHCITREGFEASYTLTYHVHRPHEQLPIDGRFGWPVDGGRAPSEVPLLKRHYLSDRITARGGAPLAARRPILTNRDITLSIAYPDADDDVYFADGDSDTLIFVHEGGGVCRTLLGDVAFERHDYVFVPRGIAHRFVLDKGRSQHWLVMECHGAMHLPKQWRNEVGQLRMDAPFCHRDFRAPAFSGPIDEGIRTLVVKRSDRFHGFSTPHSVLDVVGWDGAMWPFAFPISNFQPRAGLVHLPPSWHGNFATRGALICSFVPRTVDFHPEAIPCPYPHSSVDVDEFLFYVEGNFTSRRGVGPGSMSFHPAGLPHGPHPGAYEASIGHRTTNELAVMLDCELPLRPTELAFAIEDPGYQASFIER